MHSTRLSRILRFAQDAVARRNAEAHEEGTESGFTLIELMVVLLIMAILLAIAIPTFLGVKGGAQDRAAQSNLTNGLTSAKALYSSVGSYPVAASFTATMATQEPELTFTTASVAASGNNISFDISGDGQQILLVNYSPNNGGTCWAVSDNDGTLAADLLAAAPAGDAYASWKASVQACSATTTATTLVVGTANSSAPAGFWSSAYPTTQVSP
jgi:type IV pilus assembly protein PilA